MLAFLAAGLEPATLLDPTEVPAHETDFSRDNHSVFNVNCHQKHQKAQQDMGGRGREPTRESSSAHILLKNLQFMWSLLENQIFHNSKAMEELLSPCAGFVFLRMLFSTNSTSITCVRQVRTWASRKLLQYVKYLPRRRELLIAEIKLEIVNRVWQKWPRACRPHRLLS